MTTASAPLRAATNPWSAHANTHRAQRLLFSGLIAAHLAGALCVLGFLLFRGTWGGIWAAVAMGVVIAFFAIGQGVQVAVAESRPSVVLFAALTSYVVRVLALAGLLGFAVTDPGSLASLDRLAIMTTTLVVVAAWLGGEFVAFRRLRIPVYDTEYQPPNEPSRQGDQP